MRLLPPPRFGVEYCGLRLLSVLGPVVLLFVLALVLPSCLEAFGVEGAIVGSRFAFCVGYLLCCCLGRCDSAAKVEFLLLLLLLPLIMP